MSVLWEVLCGERQPPTTVGRDCTDAELALAFAVASLEDEQQAATGVWWHTEGLVPLAHMEHECAEATGATKQVRGPWAELGRTALGAGRCVCACLLDSASWLAWTGEHEDEFCEIGALCWELSTQADGPRFADSNADSATATLLNLMARRALGTETSDTALPRRATQLRDDIMAAALATLQSWRQGAGFSDEHHERISDLSATLAGSERFPVNYQQLLTLRAALPEGAVEQWMVENEPVVWVAGSIDAYDFGTSNWLGALTPARAPVQFLDVESRFVAIGQVRLTDALQIPTGGTAFGIALPTGPETFESLLAVPEATVRQAAQLAVRQGIAWGPVLAALRATTT